MLENLVDKNRIIIGLILIFFLALFFYTESDYIFASIIAFLFIYDLVYSKIFDIKVLSLLLVFFILIVVILEFLNLLFPILYFFYFLSFVCSLFFHQYRKYFFLLYLIFGTIFIYKLIVIDRNLFYLAIILSFFNDTAAYISGNLIKGPLIAPKISPKKTWSGTLFSISFSSLVLLYFDFNIIFSLIVSLSLYLGDLYFSFIKRKFFLKDFSNLLLSHGGLLDRFDSILPVLFLFYFYYSFFIL